MDRSTDFSISDSITSLIYASGMSVLFSKLGTTDSEHFRMITLFTFVLFLDWTARIYLPKIIELGGRNKTISIFLFLKSLLETFCVFFLLDVFQLLLNGHTLGPSEAAQKLTGFLLASILWNALMLYLFEKGSKISPSKDLLRHYFLCDVYESNAAKNYTAGLKEIIDTKVGAITKKHNASKSNETEPELLLPFVYRGYLLLRIVFKFIAMAAAWHVLFANIAFFVLICLRLNFYQIKKVFPSWINPLMANVIILPGMALYLLLGVIVVGILLYYIGRNNLPKNIPFSILFACLFTFAIIIFYNSLDNYWLIMAVFTEHIFFGAFLPYATFYESNDITGVTNGTN